MLLAQADGRTAAPARKRVELLCVRRQALVPAARATATHKQTVAHASQSRLSQTLAGTAMAACVPCRLCASMAHPPRSQPMLRCASPMHRLCTGHVVCVCAPHRRAALRHTTLESCDRTPPPGAMRCESVGCIAWLVQRAAHTRRRRRRRRCIRSRSSARRQLARPGRVCVLVCASARASDSRRREARSERPTGCDCLGLSAVD